MKVNLRKNPYFSIDFIRAFELCVGDTKGEVYFKCHEVHFSTGSSLFYSCNMGTSALHEMPTHCPRAAGLRAKGWTFQSRPRVPVLQLLCNTFVG